MNSSTSIYMRKQIHNNGNGNNTTNTNNNQTTDNA